MVTTTRSLRLTDLFFNRFIFLVISTIILYQVIKSAALALRDIPEVNGRWDAKAQTQVAGTGAVDISVAVATPNGLITPIVTQAHRRGVAEINRLVKDLAGRARYCK